MTTAYLLDTNHLSASVQKVSHVRDRIQRTRRLGIRFGTCVPALCELEVGFRQTAAPKDYQRELNHLMQSVRTWPLTHELVPCYAEIFEDLSSRGRVLSQVDMLLAALTRYRNLTLLTTDRDFEALPDIRTENWLT